MGKKTSPIAFRIPHVIPWRSRWFERRGYGAMLREDVALRKFIAKALKTAGVERIEIERSVRQLVITIFSSRPGVIIGRGGEEIEKLQKGIVALLKKVRPAVAVKDLPRVKIEIQEVRAPGSSAALIAQRMAQEVEKRLPFRRVLKQTLERVMQEKGVEGAKVQLSGRLDGAEMSRTEWLAKGKLPLQSLRAEIDYARVTAHCSYGAVGIKVWVYKGEKFNR
ncbi:MAG: 30S ribosomal protein S3 [Patescibacteria group bacterium]|nr:30S ribosomal protein S3 [Patescibacteria group bacterium]